MKKMLAKINVVQIWDVLSNAEVVKIVSSSSDPMAAQVITITCKCKTEGPAG